MPEKVLSQLSSHGHLGANSGVCLLCDRLIVTQSGEEVESLTRETLRAKTPMMAYTKALLVASEGFVREAVG